MMIDTELILKETQILVKSKLNPELLLINAEKNDFTIDPINSNAWIFQNLSEEIFSYNPFVVWGLSQQPENTDATESNSVKTCGIFFEVVVTDDGGPVRENVFYKLLRYTRALESVIQKNPNKILSGINFKVANLQPTSFQIDGSLFRSAGINILATYSAR